MRGHEKIGWLAISNKPREAILQPRLGTDFLCQERGLALWRSCGSVFPPFPSMTAQLRRFLPLDNLCHLGDNMLFESRPASDCSTFLPDAYLRSFHRPNETSRPMIGPCEPEIGNSNDLMAATYCQTKKDRGLDGRTASYYNLTHTLLLSPDTDSEQPNPGR